MKRPSAPLIIAHRGASEEAPENTLDAFRLAWKQGANAVEMDLRVTKDGRVAVLHDADLRRVNGDARKVSQMKYAELKKLTPHRGKNWRGTEVKIPLLKEVLAEVPPEGKVFLEIHDGTSVLTPLRRVLGKGVGSHVTLLSADVEVLTVAKKTMPTVATGWLVDYPSVLGFERLVSTAVKHHVDALDISLSWPLDERRVKLAHDAGLKVFVWTVNDVVRAREFAKVGVDGITTSIPLRMRRQFIA